MDLFGGLNPKNPINPPCCEIWSSWTNAFYCIRISIQEFPRIC